MNLPLKNQELCLLRNFKLADSEYIHCIVYPTQSSQFYMKQCVLWIFRNGSVTMARMIIIRHTAGIFYLTY